MKLKSLRLNKTARLVLHDVSIFLHVPGIMALTSIPIALWFGEFYAISPFLQTAIASLAPAQLLYRFYSPKVDETRSYHAMLIVALTWALIPILGMIPFLGIAKSLAIAPETPQTVLAFQNGWNALFESFSGFTGTGLSVAKNSSLLPHSLQWWRSLSEWVDGAGIVILTLAVLSTETLAIDAFQLYSATGRQRTIAETVNATAKDIFSIYGLYTGLSILLLAALGMPVWAAINHGLTGIATGGFSITGNSMTDYSPAIQLAIVVIMIAGAISFPIHYQLLRCHNGSAFWHSTQHRALMLLLGIGTFILLLENLWSRGSLLGMDSLFQWVSALTTCGFDTADIQSWSSGAKLLLSVAMLMGGAAGSTAGGLKLKRIVILAQGIRWRFQQLFRANQATQEQPNPKEPPTVKTRRQIQSAGILTVLWLGLLGVGIFVLSHLVSADYTLGDIVFEATSATSNVGLSTGISASTLHWGGKLTLILLMWAGRLEIIPVLLLVISLLRSMSHVRSTQPPD